MNRVFWWWSRARLRVLDYGILFIILFCGFMVLSWQVRSVRRSTNFVVLSMSGTGFMDRYFERVILFNPDTVEVYIILDAVFEIGIVKYGFRPEEILALIQCESGFDVNIVSSAGAMGLMQVMCAEGKRLNEGNEIDLFGIRNNIEMGCRILRSNINEYGKSKGLAVYNGGKNWQCAECLTFSKVVRETEKYWKQKEV